MLQSPTWPIRLLAQLSNCMQIFVLALNELLVQFQGSAMVSLSCLATFPFAASMGSKTSIMSINGRT